MNADETRKLVQEKYSAIARSTEEDETCCGQRTAASTYSSCGEDYAATEGYVPEADLGLGCGLPTEHAGLNEAQTVLDLGCGAGNDVFVARRIVGEMGLVIGIDFSEDMLARARKNREKLGYTNTDFRYGEIEHIPVDTNTVDVVISNCVLNLVPDKAQAFAEIFRVLRPGGHFCVSDVVLEGELPDKLRQAAEYYVGCIAGALQKRDYLEIIQKQGFENVNVPKEREIHLPAEDLLENLTPEELKTFRASGVRILSATVKGVKPQG